MDCHWLRRGGGWVGGGPRPGTQSVLGSGGAPSASACVTHRGVTTLAHTHSQLVRWNMSQQAPRYSSTVQYSEWSQTPHWSLSSSPLSSLTSSPPSAALTLLCHSGSKQASVIYCITAGYSKIYEINVSLLERKFRSTKLFVFIVLTENK